jgi:two-component system, chemotaxis family, chemotaxis protein CheY
MARAGRAEADRRSTAKFWRMPVRVLIVDDSIVMRMVLERAIRQACPKVTVTSYAADGAEALVTLEKAAADGEPFDLILSDIHMPVMNGLEFLLEVQRRGLAPEVPIVMITAETGSPEVVRAMEAGAMGYILKPFTMEQLETGIGPLLRRAA